MHSYSLIGSMRLKQGGIHQKMKNKRNSETQEAKEANEAQQKERGILIKGHSRQSSMSFLQAIANPKSTILAKDSKGLGYSGFKIKRQESFSVHQEPKNSQSFWAKYG